MTFTMKHVAVFGAMLGSIAAMGFALHDWHEATTPQFVFGVIGVVGSHISAMFTSRPNE